MENFVTSMVRFLVRVVLWVMGLVFAASLLLLVLGLGLLWGLRALWARLTGQPIAPWVLRINPGAGWKQASRATNCGQIAAKQPGARAGRDLADVTDVQVKKF